MLYYVREKASRLHIDAMTEWLKILAFNEKIYDFL